MNTLQRVERAIELSGRRAVAITDDRNHLSYIALRRDDGQFVAGHGGHIYLGESPSQMSIQAMADEIAGAHLIGRPPAAGTSRQGRITITLPPETIAALKSHGNVSAFIRGAVDRALAK